MSLATDSVVKYSTQTKYSTVSQRSERHTSLC